MIMPFGIPSEDFHGGFGIPEDEVCVINYDDTDGDISDEECEVAAQEAHDELVRSLVEAGGEIRELADDRRRLLYELREVVGWLNYFLTADCEDIYYNEACEARTRAEYLLMEMEDEEYGS
jgi:hypothetical protein